MNFERRNFLRIGAAGMAASLFGFESASGQATQTGKTSAPVAELTNGSGSLHFVVKLSSGVLDMRYNEASWGNDHAFIARGTFAKNSGGTTKLYRSYFSVEDAEQVFARAGDDDHWTTVALSRSDEEDEDKKKNNVEFVTVWNDYKVPQSFRINKLKFFEDVRTTEGHPRPEHFIIDPDKGLPDFQGSRPRLDITLEELLNALDDNRDYLAFKRGRGLPHLHALMSRPECNILLYILSIIFGTDWNS